MDDEPPPDSLPGPDWNPFDPDGLISQPQPPVPPEGFEDLFHARLSRKLRTYRQYAGYTQRGLAAAANITQKTISSIESGAITDPYDITLDQLASALARPAHMSYTTAEAIAQALKDAKKLKPLAARELPSEATVIADRLLVYPPGHRRKLFNMLMNIMDTLDELVHPPGHE